MIKIEKFQLKYSNWNFHEQLSLALDFWSVDAIKSNTHTCLKTSFIVKFIYDLIWRNEENIETESRLYDINTHTCKHRYTLKAYAQTHATVIEYYRIKWENAPHLQLNTDGWSVCVWLC